MSNATPPAIKRESLHVPMRDGVKLSAHLHRPDTAEKVPALLCYHPYRKGLIGGHDPIVEQGYATVNFDVRGTGNSEGHSASIYSDAERQDGYDMVEWAAAQPWCNGNVGMWGISYGAVVAIQIAMAAPPHLKAIIARSGSDDPYTEWTNPGGSPRPYMYLNYATIMTALNFAPPDSAEVGPRWAAMWRERLDQSVPWGVSFLENIVDGPFWRARSLRDKYDQIKCAVYVVDGWADWYHSPLLRIYSKIRTPKRALIGPWSHQWPQHAVPGPRVDFQREALKWFDQFLKGKETGVLQEPPVMLFVREYSQPATLLLEDKGSFRAEENWPIPRTQWTPFYFRQDGRLLPEPAGQGEGADQFENDPRVGACAGLHGGGPFNNNFAMPLDQRPDEALSLSYTTAPLAVPVEVTGQPRAPLHIACSAPVGQVVVKLCDVAPDGTSALVTKGYLTLSHRESHSLPTPLEPGKIYQVEVELLTCAYRFAAGHCIRIDIAGADFQNVWPTPLPCVSTLYRDAARPSHVVLPLVPAQERELPLDLKPSPRAVIQRHELGQPRYTIMSDPINNTRTMSYEVAYGPNFTNQASITASGDEPANVVIRSASRFEQPHNGGRQIVVDARCVTSSDKQAFHHTAQVQITIDGKPYWQKQWAVSVPRGVV